MKRLLAGLGSLLALIFGRLSWSSPPWLAFLAGLPRRRPGATFALLGLLLALAGGTYYYLQLPTPLRYQARVSAPATTPVVDGRLSPLPLNIAFEYDPLFLAENREHPAEVSVASLEWLDKPLTQGIRLEPALPGEWRWSDDRHLRFAPTADWPAGTGYRVSFTPGIFRQGVRLKHTEVSFTTPEFNAGIDSLELYQEPGATTTRRAVATLRFSHPVDRESLQAKLSAQLVETPTDEKRFKQRTQSLEFSIDYDELGRTAYVHTQPVEIMDYPNTIKVKLDEGVAAAEGGDQSDKAMTRSVNLPDADHLFQVDGLTAQIVRNQKQQPEQIVMLSFTGEVDREALASHLQIHLMPERNQAWTREDAELSLAHARAVEWRLIPNERDASRSYNLVVDVPEYRTLYVKLLPGLASVDGFKLSRGYRDLLSSPAYPQELSITGEGSVLALSGSHKLGLLSRNLQAVRVSIDRVLPGQINHLVSQTQGDIRNPAFSNYQFDESNLAEHKERILDLVTRHPKEANYASFDLSAYLKSGPDYGLFFVRTEGWDPQRESPLYGVEDKRLVLITDLGLIVKDNADNTHDLFVQSLRDGQPVAGAEVSLLGLNGMPVLFARTDADGHARMGTGDGLTGDRQPTVYLVRRDNDIAFLPFNRAERTLNFSRFDVGGVYAAHLATDELTAFLFSDRGIYRPGEQVNLAAIVRAMDLQPPSRLPLEIEITNPRGAVVLKRRLSLPELGFLDLQYATDPTSETGDYEVDLYLIRSHNERIRHLGSTRFQVEEFQPDRLKINSRFLGELGKGWTSAGQLQVEVTLRNLFGTPAQARKVTASMNLQPTGFHFAGFAGYRFDDPLYDPEKPRPAAERSLEDAETDADGIARFELPLQEFTQGTYRLTLEVEGFEEGGGRGVRAANSLLLSPMQALVGVKRDGDLDYIHQDAERALDLVAIDSQLQRIALDNLKLRLLQRQTLSTLVRQPNGTFQYQSLVREKPLQERDYAIAAGGQRYPLPTERAGDFVFELVNAEGQRLARVPFSVVGEGNLAGAIEKNAELQVKLDKADYRPGETIEMNITAPYTGAGLITIESDRVHAYTWFTSDTTSSLQQIRLPEHLEGNAYVNVAFVRAIDSPEIYVSPLSYAVAPFSIDRSAREVAIDLEVPEIARPGKPMRIGYRTSAPSRLVVFAVDEGILQVAGYRTPEPLDFFLRKRALEVTTQQLVDLILPEFEQILRRSASGGGMMEKALGSNLNPFARRVNEPAVFWSGIVEAGPDTRTVDYVPPETFSGQLRVMAVAVSERAMGSAERKTLVRGPFVISPNLTTMAAPGDEFDVSVGLANLVQGSGPQAQISLQAEPSEGLEIVGDDRTQLTLAEGGEGRFRFRVRAKDQPGEASLRFTARLGEEEGHLSASLSVRPAVPYRAEFASGFAEDGEVELPLPRKLYPQLAKQRAAASASPLVLVEGLQRYLENFPHGCTEQIVSQTFPLIGLAAHPGYAETIPETHRKVETLIAQLRQRQVASGGFGLWPGDGRAADFPSVYAMHFLTEARNAGFAVPNDLFESGLEFLRQLSHRNVSSLESARVRALAIYLLTRNGEVTSNALLSLHEWLQANQKGQWEKDLSSAYLAAAYQLLKKSDEANKLIAGYRLGRGKLEVYSDYHSPLTLDAQYVYLLARHFPARLKALEGQGVRELADPIFGGHYNTLSASYAILALSAYGQAVQMPGGDEAIRFLERQGDGQTAEPAREMKPFPHVDPTLGATTLSVEGPQPLFYMLSQVGFDRELPSAAQSHGLEIRREFVDSEDKPVSELHQGMEVKVRLRIRSDGRDWVDNVAVVDLLPGGFEVIRSSVPRGAGDWNADYVDVREDRVVFYGRFGARVTELNYRAKVTAAGRFAVPPAYAGSLYDRRIQGHSAAGEIEVSASE